MAERFKRFFKAFGQTVKWCACKNGEYLQPVEIVVFVSPARVDEAVLEPGFLITDYITLYTTTEIKPRDKVEVNGAVYEVRYVQSLFWKDEVAYFKAYCRRLVGQ